MGASSLPRAVSLAKPGQRRWALRLALLAPGLLIFPLVGCETGAPAARPTKAAEVIVTTPITYQVTDYQDFTGRLDAEKTVELRARVTGYVTKAPFKEGDRVKEGDVLFQIDPRTYEADLNLAEANLRTADAERNLQEKVLARARQMVVGKSISKEELDQNVAAMDKARATVGSMQASRDRAQLYLSWTQVTSPITGRISRRYVDPGNLVNADNTVLTTIVTESPMYAYFDVDERTYLDLVGSQTHQASLLQKLQFPVLMSLANESDFSLTGTINFIDNQVIGTTGTVRMRAVFGNPTGNLKRGLFVRIRLPIGAPYESLLVPDEALLSDQGRKYVYVVNTVEGKDVVEYRSVEIGQSIGSLRAIKKGLTGGERVIVSGMQRVRPRAEVQVKVQAPPKPPDSPLGRLVTLNQADKGTKKPETRTAPTGG